MAKKKSQESNELTDLKEFLKKEFTDKSGGVLGPSKTANRLQAVLADQDATKEQIKSAAVHYCLSSTSHQPEEAQGPRETIKEWLKDYYQNGIDVSITTLGGKEITVNLPITATVQDLKIAIEEQEGKHAYLQDIWCDPEAEPLRDDEMIEAEPLRDDEIIIDIVQEEAKFYSIDKPPLKAALELMPNVTSLDDVPARARDIAAKTGMYFDQATGEIGTMHISHFWSGAYPCYTWEGPEFLKPDYSPKLIQKVMGEFTTLNRILSAELMTAIKYKNNDSLEKALKEGADVNTIAGHPALTTAARKGNEFAVSALLADPRVNVNAINPFELPPCTALMYAAKAGHEGVVQSLLADPRVDVNLTSYLGLTALMYAAKAGHEGVVQSLLVDPRVDANCRNFKFRETALDLAKSGRHEEIVKLLQDHITKRSSSSEAAPSGSHGHGSGSSPSSGPN